MSKKDTGINFIVPLVVYPFDVMCSFAQSDEALISSMKKVTPKGDWEYVAESIKYRHENQEGFCVTYGNGTHLIRMRFKPQIPHMMGVLVHECLHAVIGVMHRIGMPLQVEVSDEAYTYLLGYLVQQILEKLKEKP